MLKAADDRGGAPKHQKTREKIASWTLFVRSICSECEVELREAIKHILLQDSAGVGCLPASTVPHPSLSTARAARGPDPLLRDGDSAQIHTASITPVCPKANQCVPNALGAGERRPEKHVVSKARTRLLGRARGFWPSSEPTSTFHSSERFAELKTDNTRSKNPQALGVPGGVPCSHVALKVFRGNESLHSQQLVVSQEY